MYCLSSSTLAQSLVQSGKIGSVKIAARNVEKTTNSLKEKDIQGVQVGPQKEVLAPADVIIIATPGAHDDAGIQELAKSLGDVSGKIIIDTCNPLSGFDTGLSARWEFASGESGGEVIARALPNAKVYKAFNTVFVELMQSENAKGKQLMIAGDEDKDGLKIAEAVVAAVGFVPVWVGSIRYARNLEAMAELVIHMAIPPMPARQGNRGLWLSLNGEL